MLEILGTEILANYTTVAAGLATTANQAWSSSPALDIILQCLSDTACDLISWRTHASNSIPSAGSHTALTLTLTLGPGVSAQEQAPGVFNTPPPPKPRVQLKEANWEQVQNEIKKHPGKLVVLDLWSTSCLPCMKEFPKLVALQKAYPKDVVCLSLNLDYAGIKTKPPEYYRPRIVKFLTAVNADFQNYLCTTEANEFFDSIKLNSIPAVFVYGPNGKLIKRFDDKMLEPGEEEPFSYEEDINPYMKSLVARLRTIKHADSP